MIIRSKSNLKWFDSSSKNFQILNLIQIDISIGQVWSFLHIERGSLNLWIEILFDDVITITNFNHEEVILEDYVGV